MHLDQLEKEAIKSALVYFGGNKTLAAEALGISYTTLWRKMQYLD